MSDIDCVSIDLENYFLPIGERIIRKELDKIKKAQLLMIKTQQELIESLGKVLPKEKEIPTIPIGGFSLCPRCRRENLVYSPGGDLWCSSCGNRLYWKDPKYPRPPGCPSCGVIALAFHQSGLARCNACTYEFYYRREKAARKKK